MIYVNQIGIVVYKQESDVWQPLRAALLVHEVTEEAKLASIK